MITAESSSRWTRSDRDEWDILSSVGYTALLVAGWRALHATTPAPRARDQFAKYFIAASADPYWTGMLANPRTTVGGMAFPRLYGVQTQFFDEFFASATSCGIRQAVILATGLDSRSYRLQWPSGTTVFEIDRPQVLKFKAQVLAHAEPTVRQQDIATDLREDWSVPLQAAGFDPALPAAWSAEGLLPYLPAAAHDTLFDRINHLSAPGSKIAVGALGSINRTQLAALEAIYPGLSVSGEFDLSALTYQDDERAKPEEWLAEHGWAVDAVHTTLQLQAEYGETPLDIDIRIDSVMRSRYFTASR